MFPRGRARFSGSELPEMDRASKRPRFVRLRRGSRASYTSLSIYLSLSIYISLSYIYIYIYVCIHT